MNWSSEMGGVESGMTVHLTSWVTGTLALGEPLRDADSLLGTGWGVLQQRPEEADS